MSVKMMQSAQLYPYLIEEATLTLAAGRVKRIVNLKEKLPPMLRNKVPHLVGFIHELDIDPTFTTAPVVNGLTTALRSLVMTAEGGRTMVDVTGLDLRAIEAYENCGNLVHPAPDLNSASTNNFLDCRSTDMGPGGYLGNPSDWAFPIALLDTGSIQLEAPQLTDLSADCTAGTVVQRTFAMLIALDSIRIPPKMELKTWNTGGSALELGERALYHSLLMCNDADHGAIAAGDFGAITVVDRRGPIYNGVHAAVLGRQFNSQCAPGQFGIIQGEPRAATDDNLKIVNGATPTALVSPAANYQAVLWSPPGSRINKVEAEGPIRVSWAGSQATAFFIGRRSLPRGEQEVTDLATVICNKLNLKFTGAKVNTLDGALFTNPDRIEYMPWDVSFAK